MYPSGLLARRLIPRAKGKVAHGKEIEVDSILTDITSLVVFEMKASWIREETILDAIMRFSLSNFGSYTDLL